MLASAPPTLDVPNGFLNFGTRLRGVVAVGVAPLGGYGNVKTQISLLFLLSVGRVRQGKARPGQARQGKAR